MDNELDYIGISFLFCVVGTSNEKKRAHRYWIQPTYSLYFTLHLQSNQEFDSTCVLIHTKADMLGYSGNGRYLSVLFPQIMSKSESKLNKSLVNKSNLPFGDKYTRQGKSVNFVCRHIHKYALFVIFDLYWNCTNNLNSCLWLPRNPSSNKLNVICVDEPERWGSRASTAMI